jgi:hypothetical protein
MSIYYRVLEKITIDNWRSGRFNSLHPTYHPFWDATWAETNGSRDPALYDLEFSKGKYTPGALQSYFQLKTTPGLTKGQRIALDLASRQLDGVCAWTTPQQAWDYAIMNPEACDETWVAVFDGEWVKGIPEEGGVQARVVHDGYVYTLRDFASGWSYPSPPPPAPAKTTKNPPLS